VKGITSAQLTRCERLEGANGRNAEPVDPSDQDNPLGPPHGRMRAFDRDLIRGGHYARQACRKQFDAADEEALDPAQQDMFPGLQSRYPAAHADDEEPSYVMRDAMTARDVAFNVRRLRREGKTKIGRADALEAWWEIKMTMVWPAA
jgi:hypothetical protein